MSQNDVLPKQLTDVLDKAPCGIGIFEFASRQGVFFNEAYYELIGYSPEETAGLIGTDYSKLIMEEDQDAVTRQEKKFEKNQRISESEYRIVKKNGEYAWIKLSLSPITLYGKEYAFGTFVDITKEKDSSQKLNFIADYLESSISIIKISNGHESIYYSNNAFYKMIGIKKEIYDLDPEKYDRQLVSDKTREETAQMIQRAFKTGLPQELVYKLTRPDGTAVWLNRHSNVLKTGKTDFLLVSIVSDITESINDNAKKEIEAKRYALTVKQLKADVFDYDNNTEKYFVSDTMKKYIVSDYLPLDVFTYSIHKDWFHLDDTSIINSFLSDIRKGKEHVECLAHLKLRDGSFCYCRLINLIYFNKKNEPTRSIGIIQDVNEEKQKSIIMQTIVNELPGGIAILNYDRKLKCSFFSHGLSKILGYSDEEMKALVDQNELISSFVYHSDVQGLTDEVEDAIGKHRTLSTIKRFKGKDGSIIWIHISSVIIRNNNEDAPLFYTVFTIPSLQNEFYRGLLFDADVGIYVGEVKEDKIVYCNDIMADFFSLNANDLMSGKKLDKFVSSDQKLLNSQEIENLSFEKYSEFHKKSGTRYFSIRAKKLLWNDTECYVIYVSDETEEHKKKASVDEVISKIPGGICIFRFTGKEIKDIFINDGFYTMIRENRTIHTEYYPDRLLSDVYLEDQSKYLKCFSDIISGKKKMSVVEYRNLVGKDRQYLWIRMAAKLIRRENNLVTIFATFSEVTEAVKARFAIEESNRVLEGEYRREVAVRQSLEKGAIIIAAYEFHSGELIHYSDSLRDKKKHIIPNMDGFYVMKKLSDSIPLRSDKLMFDRFSNIRIAKAELKKGQKEKSIEVKVKDYAGNMRWIKIVRYLIRSSDGKKIMNNVYVYDIDYSKREELIKERVISDEYDFIVSVDTHTGMARLFLGGDSIKNNKDLSPDNVNNFLKKDIFSDDTEEYKALLANVYNLKKLKESLAKEDELVVIGFTVDKNGVTRRKRTKAGYLDKSHETILISRRDITDTYKKDLENQKKLQDALESANTANKSKTEFLSNMSHDMRTPFNCILGSAALLLDKKESLSKEVLENIVDINSSGHFLLGLINDVLDMSQIEKGKMVLHPVPYPYSEFYHAMNSVIKPLCIDKNISFDLQDDKDAPLIMADKVRYEQLFFNIFSNAVKYTPPGGKITHFTEGTPLPNGYVNLKCHIIDNGIGMSKEFQKNLFVPFSQENQKGYTNIKGTGLGLSIAYYLAQKMGGGLEVHSQLGKGTEVIVHTVMKLADSKDIKASESHEVCVDFTPLKGKRVLMAEDNEINMKIGTKILETKGLLVTQAFDGKECFDIYKKMPVSYFDFILMDVRMPNIDGLECTRMIRNSRRKDAKTIPIIAMTANAFSSEKDDCMEAGMDFKLTKPIEPNLVFQTLVSFLKKKKKRN